jgi:DNA-binding response OmpR family regulator
VSAPRRILVVDDDADIRDLTRFVLVDAGFEVLAAPSGREALRIVRDEAVDLVLLDINMPEMDGWQTLRLMQADDAGRRLPVVMFSVKSEFRDRIVGMQEGAADYVTKPFRADELVERLRRVLDAAHPQGPASPSPLPTR